MAVILHGLWLVKHSGEKIKDGFQEGWECSSSGKKNGYSFEDLSEAIETINENPERSIRSVGKKFVVPETKLKYNLVQQKKGINICISYSFGKT